MSLVSLNAFDQQLSQLLNAPIKAGYDIMQYNEYFSEKPPPIRTQNNFSEYDRGVGGMQKFNPSGSQFGGKGVQAQGINDRDKIGSMYLKPTQSNVKLGEDRVSGFNGSQNPLNDYLKPNLTDLGAQNTLQSQTDNKFIGVKPPSQFGTGMLNNKISQSRFEGFNPNALNGKNNLEVSNFGRFNSQDIGKKVDALTVNPSEGNSMNYLQKYTSQNPSQGQALNLDVFSKSNAQDSKLQYSKSPPPENFRLYNDYISNVATKYGQKPIEVNNSQTMPSDPFKSHLMSKKVSTRLANKSPRLLRQDNKVLQ